MACGNAHISRADNLALGAIQIMLGIFNVLMWYFLLVLYMGQIKGVFGKYEPLTYKAGCTLWGVFYIMSGVCIIKSTRNRTRSLTVSALGLDILCIIVGLIAIILTVVELSSFKSVSYKNYGQAKLGREVSRVLLIVYHLQVAIALTHAIFMCGTLAMQITNGMLTQLLGAIWGYLFLSQRTAITSAHIPVMLLMGYPFWSSWSFIFSGSITVVTQKRPQLYMITYLIVSNIFSACIAGIGLLLLILELGIATFLVTASLWQMKSAKMLSGYMLLFTTLQMFVSCVVTQWAYQAKQSYLHQ